MPPIRIDTPSGPIWLDPVTGEMVAAPSAGPDTSGGNSLDAGAGAYPPHYGLAGPSQVGGAATSSNTGGSDTSNVGGQPKQQPIVDVLNLGGGRYQYRFADGSTQIYDTNADNTGGGGGGVSATTAYAQQQQNARDAAALAEQKRQFDLQYANAQTPAERAALLAEQQRQFDQSQALSKGNTLLGLGSRPDTLIKYLYALRGQQTPQGIQNTTANLPGYGNVLGGGGAPGASAPGSAAPSAAAPMVDSRVAEVKQAIATPGAPLGQYVAPGGTSISQTDPRLGPVSGQFNAQPISGPATANQGPTNEQLGAQDALIKQGRIPRFYSNGVAIFGEGGTIPEPVAGIGLMSGQRYLFGEAGPEHVVKGRDPDDTSSKSPKGVKAAAKRKPVSSATDVFDSPLPGVGQVASRQHMGLATPDVFSHGMGLRLGGVNAFASGGTIGYQSPTQADKAFIGGQWIWAGGPYSGMPVASTPANAGDLTPYLTNPNAADPTGRVQQPMASQPIPQPMPYFGAPDAGQPTPQPYIGIPSGGLGSTRPLPNAPMSGYAPQPVDPGFSAGIPTGPQYTGGFAPPSLFNPDTLPGVIARGYNSNPATPLFPQVGYFTGQGSSLIPSMQKLTNSTGTERSLYSGALQDEFGVQPQDVFDLARQLNPGARAGSVRGSRYAA